jgi:diguanylate cyclase (GGDEF)-like protein
VLLPETESAQAFNASERIRTALEITPLEMSGGELFITVSIGIAGFPEHGKELREIIAGADKSLYKSKEKGRNRVSIFQMVV